MKSLEHIWCYGALYSPDRTRWKRVITSDSCSNSSRKISRFSQFQQSLFFSVFLGLVLNFYTGVSSCLGYRHTPLDSAFCLNSFQNTLCYSSSGFLTFSLKQMKLTVTDILNTHAFRILGAGTQEIKMINLIWTCWGCAAGQLPNETLQT